MNYSQVPQNSIDQDKMSVIAQGTPLPVLRLRGSGYYKVEQLRQYFLSFHDTFQQETELIQTHHWDYVIALNTSNKNKQHLQISQQQAQLIFKTCFQSNIPSPTLGALQKLTIQQDSFMTAFDELSTINGLKKFNNLKFTTETLPSNPQDFPFLIRNVILIKLVLQLKLRVKLIESSLKDKLFIVVYGQEERLMKEAQRTGFSKQLEIGTADLSSLQPCDQALRPFRLLKFENEDINKAQEHLLKFYNDAFQGELINNQDIVKFQGCNVTLRERDTYLLYLEQMKKNLSLMVEDLNYYQRMKYYKKSIKRSMFIANLQSGDQKIKNLWERLNVQIPIGPYTEFRNNQGIPQRLKLYWKYHKNSDSIFSNADRIKLLLSSIMSAVSLTDLKHHNLIQTHFPLHEYSYIDGFNSQYGLKDLWKSKFFKQKIPLSKIRNYYGQKIAFYFAFMQFYQNQLLIPSLLGILVAILQFFGFVLKLDELTLIVNGIFSVFIPIWAVYFTEKWLRQQSALAVKWGMTDFTQKEINRPQFRGNTRRSPVNDEMEQVYFSPKKRLKLVSFSVFINLLMVCFIISLVASILVLRAEITDSLLISGFDFAGILCGFLNAIQIVIFNYIYQKLSYKLTKFQNHRTQSEFSSSLILKTFSFQLVNTFNSLFYIAFIKSEVEGCLVLQDDQLVKQIGASCYDQLYIQIYALFIVEFLKNFVELGVPWLVYKYKHKNRVESALLSASRSIVDSENQLRYNIEKQMDQVDYINYEYQGSIMDYLELSVLFCFITLFPVVCPLACGLSMIALYIEMSVDKTKLFSLVKRPVPMGARNIGMWYHIFRFLSYLSIFTNTAILCFTTGTFDRFEWAKEHIFDIYWLSVMAILVVRSVVMLVIPDIPARYETILKRHSHIIDKKMQGRQENDIDSPFLTDYISSK